jgi:hypothetical protein
MMAGLTTVLLYITATGHVVAGTTLAAPPSGDVDVTTLAGDYLPWRFLGNPLGPGFAQKMFIPSAALSSITVDADAAPIGSMRWMSVSDGKPLNNIDFSISFATDPTLKGTTVTVTLPTGVTPPPKTVCLALQLQTVLDPHQVSKPPLIETAAVANASDTTVDVTVGTLDSGTYWVLTLIPGVAPHLSSITV